MGLPSHHRRIYFLRQPSPLSEGIWDSRGTCRDVAYPSVSGSNQDLDLDEYPRIRRFFLTGATTDGNCFPGIFGAGSMASEALRSIRERGNKRFREKNLNSAVKEYSQGIEIGGE
eukprot:1356960-Amorphochlora_amoeboformis.AAC.1